MMPAGHHSDSDSTLLPLPKSAITWLGGIFARLPPLAARLLHVNIEVYSICQHRNVDYMSTLECPGNVFLSRRQSCVDTIMALTERHQSDIRMGEHN